MKYISELSVLPGGYEEHPSITQRKNYNQQYVLMIPRYKCKKFALEKKLSNAIFCHVQCVHFLPKVLREK